MKLGIVDYINVIQPKDRFNYLTLLVISIWFFNSVYKPEVSFLIALIIGVSYVMYSNDVVNTENGNLNVELETKLNELLKKERRKPPRYFYTEPDFINFFHSIMDFRVYNRDSYVRSIRTADILLSIRNSLKNDFKYTPEKQLESWQNFELQDFSGGNTKKQEKTNIKNHRQMFELAEGIAHKSLNFIHSFIVNLPANKFYREKHQKAMKRYNILVFRVLDDILFHCKEYADIPELIGVDYGKQKPYKDDLNEVFEYFYH